MNGNFDSQIISVPADELKLGVNIRNIRTVFDETSIKELAESIYRDGLQNPLTVMSTEDEDGDEIIELVSGERRYRAICYIQNHMDPEFMEEGVPAIVYTGAIHDAEFVNATENLDRRDLDDVDVAGWLYRRVQDGVSQQELAEKLHRGLPWVNNRVTFFERGCDELKDAVRNQIVSFTAGYELAKNLEHEDQRKWVKKAIKFGQKIRLEEAQRAGKPDMTKRPGKKERTKMREFVADEPENTFWRGVEYSLRWVDGLLSEDELKEALEFALTDE